MSHLPTADDYRHMAHAIGLALRPRFNPSPNPRTGCVIVRDDAVVGEGWHQQAGGDHAEVMALKSAGTRAKGGTAYITLEPCCHQGRTPPCTQALLQAGIRRVVAASLDPNPLVAGQGFDELKAAGIEVQAGVLEAEAEKLNPGFLQRMRCQRPFVRCKLAMSLDGRTAMASGESQWITGGAAREDVQRLRARSDAILTGVATIIGDNPRYTIRLPDFDETQIPAPLLVVTDSQLRIPNKARIFQRRAPILLVHGPDAPSERRQALQQQVELLGLPLTENGVDLDQLMSQLGKREINELLLEAGATLSGSMLAAGLVDELVLYVAPQLMGDGARGLFQLPELTQLQQALELDIKDVRSVGRDLRITARPILL